MKLIGSKRIAFRLLACLCCIAILAGCGNSAKKLIGQWRCTEGSLRFNRIEFFSDGTYTSDHSNYNGNYSIEGDRMKLSGILVEPITMTYELEGDQLLFYIDGLQEPVATFEKQ